MSSWGWPQWAFMVLLVFSFVQNIRLAVKESQMTHEQLVLKAAEMKTLWQLKMGIGTAVLLVEVFILAKGGFWG